MVLFIKYISIYVYISIIYLICLNFWGSLIILRIINVLYIWSMLLTKEQKPHERNSKYGCLHVDADKADSHLACMVTVVVV